MTVKGRVRCWGWAGGRVRTVVQLDELGSDGDGVLGDDRVRAETAARRDAQVQPRLDHALVVAVLSRRYTSTTSTFHLRGAANAQ